MRHIGNLPQKSDAVRLSDYLLTQGIGTRVEPAGDGWSLWVLNEDDVTRGRGELEQFAADPTDARYDGVATQAEAVRRETARRQAQAARNLVDVRKQWSGPAIARRPVTLALIAASVLVGLLTDWGRDHGTIWDALSIATVDDNGRYLATLWEVRHGQVWRLVTPIFLHVNWVHLLVNMVSMASVGSLVERSRGPWRTLALVLAIAVPSNLAEYAWSGPLFAGMSGVIFGLFGFAWIRGLVDPASRLRLDARSVVWMLMFMVLCYTGLLGSIANAAHTVGLLTGMALGALPLAWRWRK